MLAIDSTVYGWGEVRVGVRVYERKQWPMAECLNNIPLFSGCDIEAMEHCTNQHECLKFHNPFDNPILVWDYDDALMHISVSCSSDNHMLALQWWVSHLPRLPLVTMWLYVLCNTTKQLLTKLYCNWSDSAMEHIHVQPYMLKPELEQWSDTEK